ncbi:MAG: TetR/AcrR family transcriptional regulator [Acidimicrobiia bacterium]
MTTVLPPPPTTRKARATYEAIISSTRAVLRSQGVLSPELIADHAGVSPATFYTYFSSKDAVLAAAFDATLEAMTTELDEALSIEGLLDNGLEATTQTIVRKVIRGFSHDARIFRLAISRLPDSETIRQVYRHHEGSILTVVGRFLELGQAAGMIRKAETEAMAAAFLVTVQGYQNPLILRPGSGPLVEELTAMVHALFQP